MQIDLTLLFTILVIFSFCHYLADFPLQNDYHLGKFFKEDWVIPLASHVNIHSIMMTTSFYISGLIAYGAFDIQISFPNLIFMAMVVYCINFIAHFIIDRVKASPNMGGRWKHPQKAYYNALGADQFAHELFNYIYVVLFFITII